MATVYYDAQCGFCSRLINKIKKDKKLLEINFLDISKIPQNIHNEVQGIDSIIFVEKKEIAIYSDAIIKLFKKAGRVYKFLAFLMMGISQNFLDIVYRYIAKHRYFLFGKSECEFH